MPTDEGTYSLSGIEKAVAAVLPESTVLSIEPFGADEGSRDDATLKAAGYGKPLLVSARDARGDAVQLVFHTAAADEFGHNRRSDRAREWLLAYDTFSLIPRHVEALDVGAITSDGTMTSLGDCGEFYLLTEFRPGTLYVDDLRSVAAGGSATDVHIRRAESLAQYLAELHQHKEGEPFEYRRAIRNLVGDGEGIFGMIDGYPTDTPEAPPDRLKSIERACADWRWKTRGREQRLSRIHGDFHPFNILFADDGELTLLDASRGCKGDPADDVTALSVNYLFFALQHPGSWQQGFGELWSTFWRTYLDASGDERVLEIVPPYLTWRLLVVGHPKWYPDAKPGVRNALLEIAEAALASDRFDPDSVQGRLA